MGNSQQSRGGRGGGGGRSVTAATKSENKKRGEMISFHHPRRFHLSGHGGGARAGEGKGKTEFSRLRFAPLVEPRPALASQRGSVRMGEADVQPSVNGESREEVGAVCAGVLFFKSTWHFNKLLHPEHSDKQGLASVPQRWLLGEGYAVNPHPGSAAPTL